MARSKTRSDAGQAEVQAKFDEATSQGFFGTETEGKDRDAHTVAGVTGGTDHNDDDTAAANTGDGASGEPEGA